MERVLVPSAVAFLKAHGVPPRHDWSAGAVPPEHSKQVSRIEAIRYVASLRRGEAQRRHSNPTDHPGQGGDGDRSLIDHPLCSDADAHPSLIGKHVSSSAPTRFAHQEEVVERVCRDQHARSGVIVKPCGSGKTETAMKIAFRIREPVLIAVPSDEIAQQWVERFRRVRVPVLYCNGIKDNHVPDKPVAITVITYAMLVRCTTRAPAELTDKQVLVGNVWKYGLMILDEAWTMPAASYARACAMISTKVRIGLTADERRADGRQHDMYSFVGPVLYHMTSSEAVRLGIITKVQRSVEKVPTTPTLRQAYARATPEQKYLLAVLNPQKIHALLLLLRHTNARKVVVFCDKIAALGLVEDVLRISSPPHLPFAGTLSGCAAKKDRHSMLSGFAAKPSGVALFTRVGNTGLDIPDVELIVELSVVDGSAQQKTQRDGRAQRVAPDKNAAAVVTLASVGTHEVKFAASRASQVRDAPTEWKELSVAESLETPWSDASIENLVQHLTDKKHARAAPGHSKAPPCKRARLLR